MSSLLIFVSFSSHSASSLLYQPVDLSGVLQQPGPSAQSLQDQRSTYSHSSGAQYDSDAGGEGQDKERVWDADIGQSAGFYDVAPGELNAEDAAFWGEDELIRQIQERKKEEYERKQYEQQKQRKEGKGRGAPRTRAAAVAAGLTSDTTVTKRKSKFISMARIGSETSVGVGVGANIGSHVDDLDSSFSSASVARSTSKTTKKVVAKVADDRARLVSGQDSPGDSEAPRVMSGGILDEFYSI